MAYVQRGRGGLGDATGSAVGAGAGTLIAGPVGTTIGGLLGGLFGKGPAPQNQGGPAAFARWANEGHYDWVASVALNMSGPNWQQDPNDTGQPWKTGYSPADAASATTILAQHGLTPQQAAAMRPVTAAGSAGAAGLVSVPYTPLATGITAPTSSALIPASVTSFVSSPLGLAAVAAVAFLALRKRR